MIIDLTIDNEVGYDNYVNEYKIKSDNLLLQINKINERMKVRYNYIVIPMSIYNIIECSDYFKSHIHETVNDETFLRRVGTIGEFECYLDIHLPSNEILISWDKATSRDLKIESILSNSIIEKQKKIKVIP